jgi:hypothetical protein
MLRLIYNNIFFNNQNSSIMFTSTIYQIPLNRFLQQRNKNGSIFSTIKIKNFMKQLFSTLFFVALATFAQAANIILDNTAAPNTPNVYTTAQAAYNAAQAGDVIYVKGSNTSYGTLTIKKKISLIGPGYFLAANPKTQVQVAPATFDHIILDNGSNNSLLRGISVVRGNVAIVLDSTNNILIEGCYVRSQYGFYGHTHGIIATNSSNITISKSYVFVHNNYSYTWTHSAAIHGSNSVFTVQNSIISNGGYHNIASNAAILSSGSIVKNCVFLTSYYSQTLAGDNCIIEDCIVVNVTGGVSGSNNLIRNNIATTNILPTNNNNQNNIAGTSLFVDYDGTLGYSTDGKWQLKAGSPAIGTGYSGGDIGAFGGTFPYVLSGTVGPHIYSLTHSQAGSTTSGLIVTIKARVN